MDEVLVIIFIKWYPDYDVWKEGFRHFIEPGLKGPI